MKTKHATGYFLLNPENYRVLNGHSRRLDDELHRFWFWFRSALAIVGLGVMLTLYINAVSNALQVALNGATTTGTVIERRADIVGPFPSTIMIYSYTVDGVTYQNRNGVSQNVYDRAALEPLTVRYARHHPALSELEPPDPKTYLIAGGMVVLISMAGVFWFVELRQSAYRLRRLEREGVIVPGEVTSVIRRGGRSEKRWKVSYQFQPPEHDTPLVGTYRTNLFIWNTPTPPPIGTPLAIVYVDETIHQPL